MLEDFAIQFLHGTWLTLQLALCALALGLLLGALGALAKLSEIQSLRWLATTLTTLIRGIPELLVLFFIYFGGTLLLTKIMGAYVEIHGFVAGTLALALLFGAYATEVLRAAYQAIPVGQRDAALAFGFRPYQILWYIMLPQVWRHALPGLGNLWLVLLKDTALVSLIGQTDLMRVAQNVTAFTRQPFTCYLAAAGIYLALTTLSSIGQHHLEKHHRRYLPGVHYG